jgi:hypothetical protein
MFDWGCVGREWYKDRIKDFEVLERWCILHNIVMEHYEHGLHCYSFEVELIIAIELGLDSVFVELVERGITSESDKMHEYCIEIDLTV